VWDRVSANELIDGVAADAEEAACRLDVKNFVVGHQWYEEVGPGTSIAPSSALRIGCGLAFASFRACLDAQRFMLQMYTQTLYSQGSIKMYSICPYNDSKCLKKTEDDREALYNKICDPRVMRFEPRISKDLERPALAVVAASSSGCASMVSV
jgi:hypothetical protein